MESLLKELEACQVPVWTEAAYLQRMSAWRQTLLHAGGLGVTSLVSSGHEQLVVKQMKRRNSGFFAREVRALNKVRGLDGMQRVEAAVLEGEHYVIVSRFAGATLGQCVEKLLLSPAQLEDVLEQVTVALECMHTAGVVHMDLHQDNVCVLIGEKRVQATIIDLGLARFDFERHFEKYTEEDLHDHNTLAEEMRKLLLETPASEDDTKDEDESEGDLEQASKFASAEGEESEKTKEFNNEISVEEKKKESSCRKQASGLASVRLQLHKLSLRDDGANTQWRQ